MASRLRSPAESASIATVTRYNFTRNPTAPSGLIHEMFHFDAAPHGAARTDFHGLHKITLRHAQNLSAVVSVPNSDLTVVRDGNEPVAMRVKGDILYLVIMKDTEFFKAGFCVCDHDRTIHTASHKIKAIWAKFKCEDFASVFACVEHLVGLV